MRRAARMARVGRRAGQALRVTNGVITRYQALSATAQSFNTLQANPQSASNWASFGLSMASLALPHMKWKIPNVILSDARIARLRERFGRAGREAAEVEVRGAASAATRRGITVDLFGGEVSQVPKAINVDIKAAQGVRGSARALPFRSGSVEELIASGPRAEFLTEASRVVKPGGRIFINATRRNGYARIPNASTLERLRLRVISEGPLDARFNNQVFRFVDGTTEIAPGALRTIIMERY